MAWTGPILDNHLHLDTRHGRGLDAVREFASVGGSHLLVVNKPSWDFGVEIDSGADFRVGFEETISVVEAASALLEGQAWAVLGVHPALVSRLIDERGLAPDRAERLMCAGIDEATDFVRRGQAIALKSGRPHYPVSEDEWMVSNTVLQHAIDRAAASDCALQLHTEATSDLTEVTTWAASAGLPTHRVVKHYADSPVDGPVPSVISRKEALEAVVERGDPFLMETDYLDDPERPGAVLGPKTVPRRVAWLDEVGDTGAIELAHVETPKLVYGIDLASA